MGKQSYGNGNYEKVTELYEGVFIEGIIPVVDEVESVAFKVATYARDNRGNIHYIVKGTKSGTVYAENTINVKNLQDNSFQVIKLSEKLNNNIDNNISIQLQSDGQEGSSVGIYYTNIREIENGHLFINYKEIDGDLTFRMMANDADLMTFYNIQKVWLLVSVSFLILLLLLINPKYEVFFAIVSLIIGISFCMVITPMSVPDEQAHYEFAFQMSNYMMNEDDHLLFDSEYQNYGAYAGHLNVSSAYKKLVQKFNSGLSLDNNKVTIAADIEEIYHVDFIAPGLGITIARLLKLNRIKTFYMGRLFNLFFYTFCVYLAVRKTPVHKALYGIIATTPMFMQQAASYSYDCFVNGLSLAVVAYLLKFILVDEKAKRSELITAIVVCTILSPAKAIYSFFSLLFWLVPANRFNSKKEKIIFSILVCLSGAYQLLDITIPVFKKIGENVNELSIINRSTLSLDNNLVKPLSEYMKITIGDMVRNPMMFISMVYRTIRYNIKNWYYGSLGRVLSGNSLVLPSYLVHAMALITIISAFRKEDYVEPIKIKVIFFTTCVIIGLYTIGGFLLTWTDMGQDIIEDFGGAIVQGIQGRYFCPLLPFAYVIFNNKHLRIPEKFDSYIIIAHFLTVFEVVMYVLSYTFVN